MGGRRRNLLVLGLVLGLLAASAIVIATKPTVLGLDLRGGTQLVYQARATPQTPEVTPEAIDRAINIIRTRTDKFGVSEPEISRLGRDGIQVGLPNVQNAQQAIDQIGTTAQLYFYDLEANIVPPPKKGLPSDPTAPDTTPPPQPQAYTFPNLYEAVKFASKRKPECIDNKCTASGPTYYLFDKKSHELRAGPAETKDDLFLNARNEKQPPGTEILTVPQGTVVAAAPAKPSLTLSPAEISNSPQFVLTDRPALNGTEITNPQQNFDPTTNQPNVTFEFTDSGKTAFQEVTRTIAQRGNATAPPGTFGASAADQYSQHFAIVLDNQVFSNPIINFAENPDGIDGRTGAQISGSFDINSAQDLATILQTGALPVKLALESQSTVSATLGQQALDQGLLAGAVGLLCVVIFLLLYYRLLGAVAVLGLAVYGVFFFALVKLIPITLTLPGIAGLILTIGVAADANIVIFERIKEEARAGRSMLSAIAQGYRKGIATIVDANVITLFTAFILFVLATAGVKGFAFTLGIGTLVSLFTAVLFTQAVLGSLGRSKLLHSPRALGAGQQRVRWRFDFSGASRWFFSMSGMILAIGAISLATKQLNLGIDFTSGAKVTASFQRAASVDDVRSALEKANVTNASSAEIQTVTNDKLGPNVIEIQGKIPLGEVNGTPTQPPDPEAGAGAELRLPRRGAGIPEHLGRAHLRRPGGAQRGDRDHLLAAGDLGLRRDPVRAQVRGPGDHRPLPRHPDHRRGLLAHRAGGDQRHGGRLPDHPRLLDVRHGDRLRPDPRERAADAAGGVLPDRQQVDERGAHPVVDHRSVDGLPGHRAVHLRRRDPEGLRVRDDGRRGVRRLFLDLHRHPGAHPLEGA